MKILSWIMCVVCVTVLFTSFWVGTEDNHFRWVLTDSLAVFIAGLFIMKYDILD